MLPYLRFNHKYEVLKLQWELSAATDYSWKSHFNTKDYHGKWESISLRSQSGKSEDIMAHFGADSYVDTPLMAKLPYIKSIIDSLKFEKEAIRLMALHPGAEILPHRDNGCNYSDGSFRLHLPIKTNPGVRFTVNGEELFLDEGSLWYIDFDQSHSVLNHGTELRCHLVIDGLRNKWSDQFFTAEGFDLAEKKKQYDPETLKHIIDELALIGTPGSLALISDLRKQLNE